MIKNLPGFKKKKGNHTQPFSSMFFGFAIFIAAFTVFFLSNCQNTDKTGATLSPKYLSKHLTTQEKIDLLGGTGMGTIPVPRFRIPSIRMNDGPLGVRWGHATSFPSGIAMASTWDTALIRQVGQGLGREERGKGRNILLGPNVNIARNPLNGRTFEGFGEDPFLTTQMGVSYIIGVQEEGVGATVKHFVANSQELNRHFIDEKIGERALHEIYFPAFKAAVQKANVVAVMAAYNKVNGAWCSSNHFLLNTILRKEWHYKGLIMSDWNAVHSAFPTINNGLDLEMPTGKYMNSETILPALKSGKVKMSTINSKVDHILSTEFRLHLLPKMKYPQHRVDSLLNAPETRKTALQAAIEGIVLLKNKHHLLPVNTEVHKNLRIAVIGPNAAYARPVGGGSAQTQPNFAISPLEALQKDLKGKARIEYAPGILFQYPELVAPNFFYEPDGMTHGLKAAFYNNNNFKGKPVVISEKQIDFRQGSGQETPLASDTIFKGKFTLRLTGQIKAPVTGTYSFSIRSAGPVTLVMDNRKFTPTRRKKSAAGRQKADVFKIKLEKGHLYPIQVDYHGKSYNPGKGRGLQLQLSWDYPRKVSIAHAVSVAAHSDIALVFAGTSAHFEHEGADRKNLILPDNQDDLIRKVAEVNKNTVVILTTGAPVTVSQWIDKVPALLETWFDSEYIGSAISKILLGQANPSGKLPVTFPKSWKQEPEAVQHYRHNDTLLTYSDGIYVGYRYFETKKIQPQFPFGYGLSYTTFKFSDLKIENHSKKNHPQVDISFKITNTGNRSGAEVAQVYVHEENPKIDRPYKELKGFARVQLDKKESKVVHLTLHKDAFQYWSPAKQSWVTDPNTFDILVGSSSQDTHLKGSVKL